MAAQYQAILEGVKEKFSKKDVEVKVEIHLLELIANLHMLEDLSKGNYTISREQENLTADRAVAKQTFMNAIESDFSIGKLDIP